MASAAWSTICLLLLSVICTFFTGFQAVAICTWFQPFFLLHFFHKGRACGQKSWICLAICAFIGQSIATSLANLGCFQGVAASEEGYFAGLLNYSIVLGISMLLWLVMILPFLATVAYRSRFERARLAQPMIFAFTWTAAWYLCDNFSLMGSMLSPANSQFYVAPVMMTASLWGLEGITFLMAWFSALLHDKAVLAGKLKDVKQLKKGSEASAKMVYLGTKPDRKRAMKMHQAQIRAFSAVLLICLLYGSGRLVSQRFFQKDLSMTMRPTVGASCLVGQFEQEYSLLNRTLQRIKAGDRIVLWSEAALDISGERSEKNLLAKVGEIAKNKAYVGVTYDYTDGQGSSFNTFVLVQPDGSVGFRYRKSHPVPFVESTVTPGPPDLPVIDTELGRIGGAICFDFQFPSFIRQAGKKRADIVLEPSWTWGPTGRRMFEADSFRAVENGFTWFKCCSVGASVIMDGVSQIFDYREATVGSDLSMQLPISTRAWSVYPLVGFIFDWLVCLLALLHLLVACLPFGIIRSILQKSPNILVVYFTGEASFRNISSGSTNEALL